MIDCVSILVQHNQMVIIFVVEYILYDTSKKELKKNCLKVNRLSHHALSNHNFQLKPILLYSSDQLIKSIPTEVQNT